MFAQSGGALGGTSEQKVAQVVTAGIAGTLVEVRLPISCDPTSMVTVQIQGVTAAGAPDGNIQSSVNLQLGVVSIDALRAIPLTTPVRLAAGALFAIVAIGPQTDSCGTTFGPQGDTYPRGKAFYDARPNIAGWVADTQDRPFQTVMAP
jgi:hypothetical protein